VQGREGELDDLLATVRGSAADSGCARHVEVLRRHSCGEPAAEDLNPRERAQRNAPGAMPALSCAIFSKDCALALLAQGNSERAAEALRMASQSNTAASPESSGVLFPTWWRGVISADVSLAHAQVHMACKEWQPAEDALTACLDSVEGARAACSSLRVTVPAC